MSASKIVCCVLGLQDGIKVCLYHLREAADIVKKLGRHLGEALRDGSKLCLHLREAADIVKKLRRHLRVPL